MKVTRDIAPFEQSKVVAAAQPEPLTKTGRNTGLGSRIGAADYDYTTTGIIVGEYK